MPAVVLSEATVTDFAEAAEAPGYQVDTWSPMQPEAPSQ